jgi:receptor protein-tyrosine kinase
MTGTPNRTHLIERAVEALGGPGELVGRGGTATVAPPRPADERPEGPAPEARQPEAQPRPEAKAAEPAHRPALPLEALHRAGLVASRGDRRLRQHEEMTVLQNKVLLTLRSLPATPGRNARLILVTSACPGEGKSFLALNLAAAMAQASPQPVLLVDVDGKPGSLGAQLGCAEAAGLRSLANDPHRAVTAQIFQTGIERLSFLPCGREKAAGQAIAAAALRVAEALPRHLIVLDAPPALATSEAATLAPVVGQALVVVQAGRTKRPELEAALDMLDACPTLQLVLNQASPGASDVFGAYGYDTPA